MEQYNFPKVTIQIVTYNNLKYLPDCLNSIFHQTYRDFQVLVIDNNSQDGTVDFLRQEFPQAAVFQNKKNLGFAKAHNQGLKLLNSPYAVFCNPDIILEADWLEKIMAKAESSEYENYGSFGGKLLRLKVLNNEINETEKTDVVDSCGLKIFKNHQVAELGAGESSQKFPADLEVFGPSGALALYRRRALDDAFITGRDFADYFDEDFFFYKEDVDLVWRLRLFGWSSLFVAGSVAYHIRSLKGPADKGLFNLFKNRREQSVVARRYSYRNHWLLLLKNEFAGNLGKYFLPIFWQESKKFFYLLFCEWPTLSALGEIIFLLPKIIKKRKLIFKKARVKPEAISRWYA